MPVCRMHLASFVRRSHVAAWSATLLLGLGFSFAQAQQQPAPNTGAAAGQPAAAQAPKFGPPYQQAPVFEKLKTDRQLESQLRIQVRNIIGGSAPLTDASNQRNFDGYFRAYILPLMTQTDEETLRTLADQRQRFFKEHVHRAEAAAHARLIQITFEFMKPVVQGNYHPAVRYNAMLMIGELNKREFNSIGLDRRPPEPLGVALDFMLQELTNPAQSDAVRVAALVGIRRHAELAAANVKVAKAGAPNSNPPSPISNEQHRKILDRALALLDAKTPPEGRTPEGHEWMQRQAIDILGFLGMIQSDGVVAKKLDELILDEKSSLAMRSAAAQALGRLAFTPNPNFDATSAVSALGNVVAQACKSQIDYWTEEKEREKQKEMEKKATGMYGGGSDMGYGDGMTSDIFSQSQMPSYGASEYGAPGGTTAAKKKEEKKPEDYRVTRTRRIVKYYAWSARQGLAGAEADFRSREKTEGEAANAAAAPAARPAPTEGGLLARASNPQKEQVRKMLAAVDNIIKLTDKHIEKEKVEDRDTLLKDLDGAYRQLVTLVDAGKARPAANVPADLLAPEGDEGPQGPPNRGAAARRAPAGDERPVAPAAARPAAADERPAVRPAAASEERPAAPPSNRAAPPAAASRAGS